MKHTYMIIVATFLFGFLAGVILFLYNNVGKDDPEASSVDTIEPSVRESQSASSETNTTVIAAYRYGGCARASGCASYRIADDGAVTYVLRGGDDDGRREDTLSTEELETLFQTLYETNLEKVSESTFSGTCPADYDGTAYRFEVTYDGERYPFDTCTQNLQNEPLFVLLEDYFDVFYDTYVE